MKDFDLREAAGSGDFIPTEPGSLEEDKHNVESFGTWLIVVVGLAAIGAALGLALGGWR